MAQQPQQPQYNLPPLPSPRQQLDFWTLGMIAAGAVVVLMCGIGTCIGGVAVLRVPPTPTPTVSIPTNLPPTFNNPILITAVPIPTIQTPIIPAQIGVLVNPYDSARLQTMMVVAVDVLNLQTGQYERKAQLSGGDLTAFVTALNISNYTIAPDLACPNSVRLTIIRADSTQAVINICLKHGVILRGSDIPDLGGTDLPMGPYFSDLLSPYLTPAYQLLLQ